MRTRNRRNPLPIGLLSACLIATPGAGAYGGVAAGTYEGAPPADQPAERQDDNLLAGPSAEQDTAPGGAGMFAQGMDGPQDRRASVRIDRWLHQIVRAMAQDDAEPDIRLTPDQVEAIRAATQAHEQRVRAYRREHAEHTRALREQAATGPDRDATPTAEQHAARQRLRAINQGAPTTDQARGEVWAALNETQREHVNAEVERMEQDFQEREYAQMGMTPDGRMMGRGGMDGMTGERARRQRTNDDDSITGDTRLDEVVRRIRALPEPQRERIIARLLGALERLEQSAAETREREAPPSMDGVDVPSENAQRPRRPRGGG